MDKFAITTGDLKPSAATEGKDTIRVVCADDHRDIRTILKMVLDAESGMACMSCLASADALVEEVQRTNAHVVIVDATMPGKDPFEAIADLVKAMPSAAAIVFTAWADQEILDKAQRAGARGWVCKDSDPTLILQAIREVAQGGTSFQAVP